MQPEIKRQLPATLQPLVDEIEAAVHTEIVVQHTPGRIMMRTKYSWSGSVNKIVISYGETIADTTEAYLEPYAMLCHELLHVARHFLQRVPIVCAVEGLDDNNTDPMRHMFTACGLENALEHVVIEPMLPRYGFGSALHRSTRDFWDSMPKTPEKAATFQPVLGGQAMPIYVGASKRPTVFWLLMHEWVKVQLLESNLGIKQRAERVMENLELLAVARCLTDELRWLAKSPDPVQAKLGMVFEACRAYRIPPQAVQLSWATGGDREYRQIPRDFTVPTADGELIGFRW